VQSYWSKQEQQVAPSCIVSPVFIENVSAAIKILTANNLTCKFAIRSDGHTTQAGSANIERGVTIDMSAFKDIRLSVDHTLVTIDSGQRWGNVYATLEPFGLAVPGDRATEVDVGGLLLEGWSVEFFCIVSMNRLLPDIYFYYVLFVS
jgi:FAD/FMN-containing dehydrogenase